ncbi:MAG: hypothetical protein IJA23_04720 [Clostridia bacterium]|nr:hypothetical protein [Clostridia bacterium]
MNLFLNFVSYPANAEQLKNKIEFDDMTDMQLLNDSGFVNWTISPNAKEGDLVLFYHTESALENIKKIEEEAKQDEKLYKKLKSHIDLSYDYFDKFGASIFAIGSVGSTPEFDENAFKFETHFKERCFADIDSVYVLKNPIKAEQVKDYINIKNQSSKDAIEREVAKKLLSLIAENNVLSFELMNQLDSFIKN